MNILLNKIQFVTKYSIIAMAFVFISTAAQAEESKRFNFGFDRLESILNKNAFNWNTSYAYKIEEKEQQAQAPQKDSPAFSAIKRFAAMSASVLVEFTSNDSFNEIEVN